MTPPVVCVSLLENKRKVQTDTDVHSNPETPWLSAMFRVGGVGGGLVRSGMSEHTRGDRSMLPRESIKFCCLEMTTNAYKTVVIFYHEVNPREDKGYIESWQSCRRNSKLMLDRNRRCFALWLKIQRWTVFSALQAEWQKEYLRKVFMKSL